MRLAGVQFDHFKSIEESELSTDGLVVIFGINSSGKSNALEGVEALVAQFRKDDGHASSGKIRKDSGQMEEETYPSGGLIVEFPDCETVGHVDHEIVRAILSGAAQTTDWKWDVGGFLSNPVFRERLMDIRSEWINPKSKPTLEEGRSFWEEVLLFQESPLLAADRRLLFKEMLRTSTFLFRLDGVSLVVTKRQLLVATHSPVFLNLSVSADLVFAQPGPPSALVPLNRDLLEILRTHAESIGLREADLMLMSKGILIVEGTDDVKVIRHFFGKELDQGRVTLLPLHGTLQAMALVETEFLIKVGKRMMILFDNVTTEKLKRAQAGEILVLSDEEEKVQKILMEMTDPRAYHVMDNPLEDIVFALPNTATATVLKEKYGVNFPGWDDVLAAFGKRPNPKESGKRFLIRYLKIKREGLKDHEIISDLIARVLAQAGDEGPPAALRVAVTSAIAFANAVPSDAELLVAALHSSN